MLVTLIASITVESLIRVTGLTVGGMVAVEAKVAVMVEGRRFPFFRTMALIAFALVLAMQCVTGRLRLMAGDALLPFGGRQQGVLELGWLPLVGAMALTAFVGDLTMQRISGRLRLVARDAPLPFDGRQQ